jgi:hypothetical protein
MGQPPQPGYTTCEVPTSSNNVIFFADAVVYPGDTVPTALRCYDNCPNAPTAAGVDLTLNNGYVGNMMSGPSTTPTDYSFSATASGNGMTLMLGSNPAILTATNAGQQFGIQSGPLFDPDILNQTDPATGKPYLQCDWMNQQGTYDVCSWKAWNELPVFYTWETGPNNWNQFIGVKDSNGTFVIFDTPLMVKYVGIGDPYGTPGATYMLQYGGSGQLQGIPGKCVDMNTGADADCSTSQNSNTIRWVPQFTIPTLTNDQPTTVTDGTNTYLVKPLQVEQRMKASPGQCLALATTDFSSYMLPDISIWTDPVVANGTEPNVTAAPAVIGGVVQ